MLLSLGLGALADEKKDAGVPEGDKSDDGAPAGETAAAGEWELSADGSYYALKNVVYCDNVVDADYQYMNIYAPAAYIDGGECNGYTAETAPIILENNCMGWNSSSPSTANTSYLAEGFVHISCGARSRDDGAAGKMPAPVVDLKAAVRYLRTEDASLPGDSEKIVSVGSSGGGQMSSILGASGDMAAYLPYLYEIGARGVAYDAATDTYTSTVSDAVYGAMCFCPITDLDNADLAYAWMRFDAGETSAATMFSGTIEFSEFQLELQNDLALAFCEYINSLGIVNEQGEVLSFDYNADGTVNPRSGSYYDQILQNMSNALNALIANGEDDKYTDEPEVISGWLTQEDGEWKITDMAGFIQGTGLARNKDIPGFDTFFATEEGSGFGTGEESATHFSASVAAVLQANYDKYAALDGFDEQDVDAYIEQAVREDIQTQAYLMNSTEIMLLAAAGENDANPALYWRTRNGTSDEHTSFTIAYNLAMSALACGRDVDYSLVWNMAHGSDEGESTGTFAEWVHRICAGDAAASAAPAAAGDVSEEAYHAYLKEYVAAVPAVSDENYVEFCALIDASDYTTMPCDMLFIAEWWGYAAMTYDEFVAAGGVYEIPPFDPGLTAD